MNLELAQLVAAYATGTKGLPHIATIRGLHGRPNVWPIYCVFYESRYTATLIRRRARLADMPTFPTRWGKYLTELAPTPPPPPRPASPPIPRPPSPDFPNPSDCDSDEY